MKTQPTTSKPGALPRLFRATFIAGILLAISLLSSQTSHAGSATWLPSPTTGDWNTTANWTMGGPPNGSAETATFSTSDKTTVSLSLSTEVDGIAFSSGASAFTTTVGPGLTLTISGVGITNNSGIIQNFAAYTDAHGNAASISFTNSATAGSLNSFTNNSDSPYFGTGSYTLFYDTSRAGSATFTNNSGTLGSGGYTIFFDNSSAGNGIFTNSSAQNISSDGGAVVFLGTATADHGTFINNGDIIPDGNGLSGETTFYESSSAGDGTFINNGATVSGARSGGETIFSETSTASNSTLIANGGTDGGLGGGIFFVARSTGGRARVEVFDNGKLDISIRPATAPRVSVGSIEGNGNVFLGAWNLTVGSNNLSTTFSGIIQDGGNLGGTGGSLTKVGVGTLILTGATTYTGGTTIKRGTLVVNNMSGSGTGSGAVQVDAGALGGRGTIAGAVTVGTGSGAGAVLTPGSHGGKPGTLTIQSALTFNSDATYNCGLDIKGAIADEVVANGVAINGAQFSFTVRGHRAIPQGTAFTVIDNTSATPISGTFSNLADGSTFIADGNTFRASYEGGDGNDLTLTVQ